MRGTECPARADLEAFHSGDLPPAGIDRVAAHLDRCRACEAVLEGLDGHRDAAGAALAAARPPANDGAAGTVLAGRYVLHERLGHGGMGTVWRAVQTEPVARPVAVKLIRAGMNSGQVLARFEAERQMLARMGHPNIAAVLDAGAGPDGAPFIVMELVPGVPVTEFCDAHAYTPRQRIELFLPVCRAVQHAHQKGVIHRDIKPSNVLVGVYDGRPVPKVIDFGVAKAAAETLSAVAPDTAVGAVVGTPEYMSPEQATIDNTDIDTRSDVYSLGVLLYELLTGSPPFAGPELRAKGLLEMLRAVRETEAPRPSTKLSTAADLPVLSANRGTGPRQLTALLRGDLDWLVMKALEKDRARRYGSAELFALDLERYLAGEAVTAHPPGRGYRVRKFLRRNRGPVAAGGAVAAALVVGLIGTALALQEAVRARAAETARADGERRQKEAAEGARDRTAEVLDAMTSELAEDALVKQAALAPKQRLFLEGVLTYYRDLAAETRGDEPTRARTAAAAVRVGVIERRLGRRTEALAALGQARDLFVSLLAEFPGGHGHRVALAGCYFNLGLTLGDLGRHPEAESAYAAGVAAADGAAAGGPEKWPADYFGALCRSGLATALSRAGKLPEAEDLFRAAIRTLEQCPVGPPHTAGNRFNVRYRLATCFIELGGLLAAAGKPAAETELIRGAKLADQLVAENAREFEYVRLAARAAMARGGAAQKRGQVDAAAAHFAAALARYEALTAEYPADPAYRVEAGGTCCNLGVVDAARGRDAQAVAWFGRSLAYLAPVAAAHPNDANGREFLRKTYWGRALSYRDLRRPADAVADWERALSVISAETSPVLHFQTYTELAGDCCNLGRQLSDAGNPADGLKQFDRAADLLTRLRREHPGDDVVRRYLRNTYWGRAVARERVQEPAAAVGDWEKAEDLSPENERRPFRAWRTAALAAAGRTEAAVRDAVALGAAPNSGWAELYALARACGTAAGRDPQNRDKYARLAVGFLSRAAAAGWKDAAAAATEPGFDTLRTRADFKDVLAALPKPSRPAPRN